MAKKSKKGKKGSTTVYITRKKEKVFDIDTNIKVAFKTGKIKYGKNQVLKELRTNPFKMIIVAHNCPKNIVDQLNYFNTLTKNKIFIHRYSGSSWELGLSCAKPYMISVIGILDAGDSDLLSLKTKSN